MLQSPILLPNGLEIDWVGPNLSEGPLPAVIYLALSSHDSLILDPFNQPVLFLQKTFRLRVFSLTLPAHQSPLEPQHALKEWVEQLVHGEDVITPFIEIICHAAKALVEKNIASTLGVCGLSRGAFFATHAAAKLPLIHKVLGFAPLTSLSHTKEFSSIASDPRVTCLDLHRLYEHLVDKTIRFYIGNRDERVNTSSCFAFVSGLAETAYQRKIRSPHVELLISPSIGYQGHGTPEHIFHQGSTWLGKQLGADHV